MLFLSRTLLLLLLLLLLHYAAGQVLLNAFNTVAWSCTSIRQCSDGPYTAALKTHFVIFRILNGAVWQDYCNNPFFFLFTGIVPNSRGVINVCNQDVKKRSELQTYLELHFLETVRGDNENWIVKLNVLVELGSAACWGCLWWPVPPSFTRCAASHAESWLLSASVCFAALDKSSLFQKR